MNLVLPNAKISLAGMHYAFSLKDLPFLRTPDTSYYYGVGCTILIGLYFYNRKIQLDVAELRGFRK